MKQAAIATVAIVALSLPAPSASQWTTMALYDVLEEDCRDDLADKDLGDEAGDAFFMLKDVYVLPVAVVFRSFFR